MPDRSTISGSNANRSTVAWIGALRRRPARAATAASELVVAGAHAGADHRSGPASHDDVDAASPSSKQAPSTRRRSPIGSPMLTTYGTSSLLGHA